jgi:hypothetical protein
MGNRRQNRIPPRWNWRECGHPLKTGVGYERCVRGFGIADVSRVIQVENGTQVTGGSSATVANELTLRRVELGSICEQSEGDGQVIDRRSDHGMRIRTR